MLADTPVSEKGDLTCRWSPDGAFIVVASCSTADFDIGPAVVYSPADGTFLAEHYIPANRLWPQWSPPSALREHSKLQPSSVVTTHCLLPGSAQLLIFGQKQSSKYSAAPATSIWTQISGDTV